MKRKISFALYLGGSLCVFIDMHWSCTLGQWQSSAPAASCDATPTSSFLPPILPSSLIWDTPCLYWLDNTQPLYATCLSARLHLREPLLLSLELPLAAFVWTLVKLLPPLPHPSFLSFSVLSCSTCCSLQTDEQKDTYRQVIASVSYFLQLPWGTKDSTTTAHPSACVSPILANCLLCFMQKQMLTVGADTNDYILQIPRRVETVIWHLEGVYCLYLAVYFNQYGLSFSRKVWIQHWHTAHL